MRRTVRNDALNASRSLRFAHLQERGIGLLQPCLMTSGGTVGTRANDRAVPVRKDSITDSANVGADFADSRSEQMP